jgi:hypothetical protein
MPISVSLVLVETNERPSKDRTSMTLEPVSSANIKTGVRGADVHG